MKIEDIFENNKKWVASKLELDENYFHELSKEIGRASCRERV